jgi:integrase
VAEGKTVFHDKRILDEASRKDGKLDKFSPLAQSPKQPQLKCPQCGSRRLYKDGLRYLTSGQIVQRWLCRHCCYRFSEKKPLQKKPNWQINTASTLLSKRQVCELLTEESKNLAEVARQGPAQREGSTNTIDNNGKVVEFLWHLKKNGVKSTTLKNYSSMLRKLATNTNLAPESVKEYLAKTNEWSDSSKSLCVVIYTSFLKFIDLSWQPPKYKPAEKVPFVPTEADIDELIAGSGRTLSTFLQFLKETGARCGEAAALAWTDVDLERRIVRITPEKGSRPRILPMSRKLIDMLNNVPKKTDNVWATLYSLKSNFYKTRKSLAFKLQNPRLKQIGLHTFRHWKATMEYHKTRDILHVQQLLGHRDLRNTLIYINLEKALFQNTDDEFHVKVAQSLEEACKLLEVGFEYVTDMDGAKLFRKRK